MTIPCQHSLTSLRARIFCECVSSPKRCAGYPSLEVHLPRDNLPCLRSTFYRLTFVLGLRIFKCCFGSETCTLWRACQFKALDLLRTASRSPSPTLITLFLGYAYPEEVTYLLPTIQVPNFKSLIFTDLRYCLSTTEVDFLLMSIHTALGRSSLLYPDIYPSHTR